MMLKLSLDRPKIHTMNDISLDIKSHSRVRRVPHRMWTNRTMRLGLEEVDRRKDSHDDDFRCRHVLQGWLYFVDLNKLIGGHEFVNVEFVKEMVWLEVATVDE